MKKIFLSTLLMICGFAHASDKNCARITKDIEENIKQVAVYEALGIKYAIKTGNMSYMDRNKPQINSLKEENRMLLQQSSSLKCKPYSGDLTGKSYKEFAKACVDAEESDPQKEMLCNFDTWK
ncbi:MULTISPECIES: hypothetical protein [unclassified Acinetobacter]|uniref:hypothetical protein n=1 Tax=unclassified Acinetobacter TaxID=196816 RepID=UPI001F4A5542|nr:MULTISPECIES: hypothetical protein [unclassified Acinetobacter]MCH7353258.1 hypothetical protein [Acinetobacter sp. NIPH 2023]MCH7360640.1 hypothetical protein [Acinetobacter sp. NIPH 2024]